MPAGSRRWLDALRDVLAVLDGEALTLLIGAGASLSSGAPTTQEVFRAFNARYPARLPDTEALRHRSHTITNTEKLNAIAPLFARNVPFVGYRCLAAVAESKRVYVLNLNWDSAVEDACKAVGVPCVGVSAEDKRAEYGRLLNILPPGKGVFCLHLHGSIKERSAIKIGTLETNAFSKKLTRFLKKHAVPHPFVAIGTTIAGDLDVVSLFRERVSSLRDIDDTPAWLFARPGFDAFGGSAAVEHLARRTSTNNVVEDHDVDFDKLMLTLAAASASRPYAALRDKAGLVVSDLEGLVWPRGSTFSSALDASVAIIIGDPYLGKTSAAHLLAYAIHVVTAFDVAHAERHECTQLLASASSGTMPMILILEDPFGQGTSDRRDDTAFLDLLEQVNRNGSRAIVTTRRSAWDSGSRGRTIPGAVALPADLAFYEPTALERYARRFGQASSSLFARIASGELATPFAVQRAARGRSTPRNSPGATVEESIIAEKLAVLRSNHPAARLAMLLKLQECHNRPESLRKLEEIAGVMSPSAPEFVSTLEIDGVAYPRHKHPTDSEAAAAALDDPYFANLVKPMVKEADWLSGALGVWQAVAAARRGELDVAEWFEKSPEEVREFLPQVVAAHREPDVAFSHIPRSIDFWTTCELVYEAASRWEVIKGPRTREWLHSVLGTSSGYGTYALLEAALYLQGGFPPELADHLRSALYNVVDNPAMGEAAGLVCDGLCWRLPRKEVLAGQEVEGIRASTADAVVGARAFAALYHPAGFANAFGSSDVRSTTDSLSPGSAAAFIRLMQWHFLHQCRARASLARRAYSGADCHWLGRRFQPQANAPETQVYGNAIAKLRELGADSGWLVHFAVNTSSSLGIDGLRGVAVEMLNSVTEIEPGVATAILTYDCSGLWKSAVLELVRRCGFDGLLRTAFDAPVVWNDRLYRRRFRFCDNADARLAELGHEWRVLERVGVKTRADLERALCDALEASTIAAAMGQHATAVVNRVRQGDLRELDSIAARGNSTSAVVSALLEAAACSRQSDEALHSPRQARLPGL